MLSARGMEVMRRRMIKLGQEPRTSDSTQNRESAALARLRKQGERLFKQGQLQIQKAKARS